MIRLSCSRVLRWFKLSYWYSINDTWFMESNKPKILLFHLDAIFVWNGNISWFNQFARLSRSHIDRIFAIEEISPNRIPSWRTAWDLNNLIWSPFLSPEIYQGHSSLVWIQRIWFTVISSQIWLRQWINLVFKHMNRPLIWSLIRVRWTWPCQYKTICPSHRNLSFASILCPHEIPENNSISVRIRIR